MADKLASVAKDLIGTSVNTIANEAGSAVSKATSDAAKDNAKTLGDQIAQHTCDELNKKIPTIVTTVTDQVIGELREKINSEEFTTNFINVLQTKLLEDKTYAEPFLAKFDNLFDIIIREAKNRHDKKEFEKEQNTMNPMLGSGYHKNLKTRKNKKSPRKNTKRVRFSMKK